MSLIGHWDALERALSEAERALRTPPRDAAQGYARVQWAQTEFARVRQQHQGAVDASTVESIVHDWTCGCGKGQACPNRDGCREAAEQIVDHLRGQ